jgi:hypothetical protein
MREIPVHSALAFFRMWTQVGIEDFPDNDTFRKPDQLIPSQEEWSARSFVPASLLV